MKKNKILIIEDDKSLVKLLSQSLEKNFYEVVLAADVEEGFAKAFSEKPDLILLDIILPEKSGFECLKMLKKTKKTEKIPVIILSNLGQEDEIKKSLELGAKDYLVKASFSIDEIGEKISKTCKK